MNSFYKSLNVTTHVRSYIYTHNLYYNVVVGVMFMFPLYTYPSLLCFKKSYENVGGQVVLSNR